MLGTGKAQSRALVALVGQVGVLGTLMLTSACEDTHNAVSPVAVAAVTVFKDPNFDFRTLRTFALPDTIVARVPPAGSPVLVTRDFDRAVIGEVRADLTALGFVEVTDPIVQPDFIVLINAVVTDDLDAFSGYPWFSFWGFSPVWRWYTPGFSNSWNIIYPWASAVNVRRFDHATLLVDIIPTSSVNASARTITAAWTGVAVGILNGTFSPVTVTSAVDKMFLLSPYLKVTTP